MYAGEESEPDTADFPSTQAHSQGPSDEEVRLHFSLPPSTTGHDVMLRLSPRNTPRRNRTLHRNAPQTPTRTFAPQTPNLTVPPLTPTSPSRHGSPSPSPRINIPSPSPTESSLSTTDTIDGDYDDPFTEAEVPYIPVHLRPPLNRSAIPYLDRYAVPAEIRAEFPAGRSTGHGFSARGWYVVKRGLEIGIFMDFWGNIEPLVKGIKNARYQGANGFQHALRMWREAVRNDETAVLR